MNYTFKKYLVLFFILPFCQMLFAQSSQLSPEELNVHVQEIFEFQHTMNHEFKDPEESPLVKDSIPKFIELHFFPFKQKFIVQANFERIENGKVFEMKTTTDRLPLYREYAFLKFKIDTQTFVLQAFQNVKYSAHPDYDSTLFIPFNDYTNGLESYGGGRYMDVKIPEGDAVIINFHLAYNPYCSYNDRYSCPIPPDENKLDVRIEAGVLKYHWLLFGYYIIFERKYALPVSHIRISHTQIITINIYDFY